MHHCVFFKVKTHKKRPNMSQQRPRNRHWWNMSFWQPFHVEVPFYKMHRHILEDQVITDRNHSTVCYITLQIHQNLSWYSHNCNPTNKIGWVSQSEVFNRTLLIISDHYEYVTNAYDCVQTLLEHLRSFCILVLTDVKREQSSPCK